MKYYCLECGSLLENKAVSESTDVYYCGKCEKKWFHVRRLIIEWVKEV